MKKFEYKILTISVAHLVKNNFQAELNSKFDKWGNDGWDLLKMEPISSRDFLSQAASTDKFLTVFKRVKLD